MMMKVIYWLAVILLVPQFILAQQDPKIYTLEECIGYALENNQDIKVKKLDEEIAKEKVDQTIATGLPQISGSLDLAYNYKVATQFLPDFISPAVYGVLFQENLLEQRNLGEPQIFPAQFGTKYSSSAVLNLQQMVFNGSYFVGLRAAKTFMDYSGKELVNQETDVVEAVSKAYYGALISREQVDMIIKNYGRLDSLLTNTRILYENGFAEKIDVSRIQIQFNNIAVEKRYAEELYNLNVQILKTQMGMPLEQELQIAEGLEDLQFEIIESFPEAGFNYADRIEYSLLQTNGELVELDMKNIQAQYFPQINLYGSYGASTGRQEFDQVFNNEWFELGAIGLAVNVPVFDGFLKKSRIEEKRIQRNRIEVSKVALRNAIDLQIEQAEFQYRKSIDNMMAQQENMKLAQEVYEVSRIKYEEGVGSNLEVTNADTDLKAAQNNYYTALYESLIAKIDLQKAYGILYNFQN
jgi:outer membrane protein